MKPIILTFAHYYLPGNLAGGPIRSIANMVDLLSDEFDFLIITSDRDYGAKNPYSDVNIDEWNTVGNARVFYASEKYLGLNQLSKLISATPHDLLYLNSFFDPTFTVKPLLARWLKKVPSKPIVVAPRGEFSQGALQLKNWKKAPYFWFTNLLGFYTNVCWHASTLLEHNDIQHKFRKKNIYNTTNAVSIAIDLLAKKTSKNSNALVVSEITIAPNLSSSSSSSSSSSGDVLKLCFLSRISPMKNLDFALTILSKVKAKLKFDIYGPQEDPIYWAKCKSLIDNLPDNIQVSYKGSVGHHEVINILAQYDLFLLPTLGENFGHVIHEAFSASLPVLISDRTPWLNLQDKKVGWSLPLESPSSFVAAIEEASKWDDETKQEIKNLALAYANDTGNNKEAIKQNVMLFRRALLQ